MDAQVQRRYGTRVRAQIPLRISSLDGSTAFTENCHTLLVNPKGCGVRFNRPLKLGLRVKVECLPGRRSATATVASNVPPSDGNKYWLVGIGLDSPGNLWCLAPTPTDWGTYSSSPEFFPCASS